MTAKKIVIVEKEYSEQALLKEVVWQIEPMFFLHILSTGRKMLKILERSSPDLYPAVVIINHNEPEIDAIDLLVRLNGIIFSGVVPVFVCGTSRDRAFYQLCLTLGATGYYLRPDKPSVLKSTLRQIMGTMRDPLWSRVNFE